MTYDPAKKPHPWTTIITQPDDDGLRYEVAQIVRDAIGDDGMLPLWLATQIIQVMRDRDEHNDLALVTSEVLQSLLDDRSDLILRTRRLRNALLRYSLDACQAAVVILGDKQGVHASPFHVDPEMRQRYMLEDEDLGI